MARISRVVIAEVAHHVTQRGVRRINIFSSPEDKNHYMEILSRLSMEEGLEIHAYCLMDNHVHLLVVPKKESSLRKVIGEAHRLYTRMINFKQNVRGHLFQERFFSCPLDESHYVATARYIERNPVRAKMCSEAWDYEFSSAKYRVGMKSKDPLLTKKDWIYSQEEWRGFLTEDPKEMDSIRKSTRTGRPLGSREFTENMEKVW
jgi:putative transposase